MLHWSRSPRINTTIVVCAVVFIAALWAVSLYLVEVERASTLREAYRQSSNLALAYEEHATRTLKAVDQLLLFVADQYREHGSALSIRRIVATGALDADLFAHVSVEDERGDLKIGTEQKLPRLNLADRDFFSAHQDPLTKGLFIGQPIYDRGARKWVIPMSRRLSKPDGSFAGVVHVSVDPGYFIRFYGAADLGRKGMVALVGLDGIIRARRTGDKGTFGEDLKSGTLLARQAQSPIGSFRSSGLVDGVPRYFSYRTLPQYPLIVMVGSAESETLAPFYASERDYYLVSGGISALLVLVAIGIMAALARQSRMLESLATSEDRFRSLTELSSDWYWEQDEAFRFTQLVGNSVVPSEDVLGRTRWDCPSVLLTDAEKEQHRKMLESHLPFRDLTIRQMGRDGQVHFISSSGEPMFHGDGSFAGYRGTGRDITERRRAEERRQAAEQELTDARIRLADADRMEAVGRLAASVAHEVKNPLAIMRLGVDYLLKQVPPETHEAAVVRDIQEAVERADNVIRGLLDFARHDAFAPHPALLNEVLENALQLMRHEMGQRNVAVERRYQAALPAVWADPGQLLQVFINLLTNAAQAIGQDGHIEVVLRSALLDERDLERDESGTFKPGDAAVIVDFRDDGPGIPLEHEKRLFQPFFTTKPAGEGTGLGLAVSRNIVIMHGGSISIRNRPEGGATALLIFRSHEGQPLDEKEANPGGG